jgi:epoxyqueuosine reductase QueG
LDTHTFLKQEGIDVSAAMRLAGLPDADRADAFRMVPSAQSVIVFGKEIPAPVYQLPSREKTREMFKAAGVLDRAANLLARRLVAEGFLSAAVPLILPVHREKEKVKGAFRLKRFAAWGGLGTIGESTLVISPRFGTRLVLGAVVTEMPAENPALPLTADLCGSCGRCVKACPAGAIGPDGVDAFRCRNLSSFLPVLLVPAAKWVLDRKSLQRLVAPFAFPLSRFVPVRCSLCVTVCPCFRTGES